MKFIIICLAVLFSSNATAQISETVVLLHGIAKSSRNMNKMETYIKTEGYNTLNISYPSTKKSLEDIVDIVHPAIKKASFNSSKIHFVAHSMGNLVVRGYLNKYRPHNLGRVVMLSPPNNGSEVADLLKNNLIYKWFYGPAGQQLTTNQSNLQGFFGTADYEVAILAGTRSIDPFSSFIIPGKDDGKVSIERMKLNSNETFKQIPATHTFIMKNKKAIKASINFIKTGKID